MSFPLSIELARKLIFKVVISKDTLTNTKPRLTAMTKGVGKYYKNYSQNESN